HKVAVMFTYCAYANFRYCDCKIYVFNDMIFNLGWKHARYTRAWFSLGVYFSLVALVGISLNLPLFSMLRIYCAGIWHNVIFCAACVLMALLLPLVLCPLYVSGDGLIVMGVSQSSSLSRSLSVHDVILSVDGLNIRRTDDWMKMLAQGTVEKTSSHEFLGGSQSYGATNSGKGYCVPNSWMDASKNLWQINDKLSCPDELIVFGKFSCNGSAYFPGTDKVSDKKQTEDLYCLIAKDVVKLKKCGNGWRGTEDDDSNCTCLEEECCLVPVLTPGFSWIEISYARPYSLECLQKEGNLSSSHATNDNFGPSPCGGTFVYVGDLSSTASSVKLSPYRPRWAFFLLIADVPYILENCLSCLLHVSAALAAVNCLPVYFLDGDAILETALRYVAWFNRRQQRVIIKVCRFLWTVLSIIMFSRFLYSMTVYYG
uniref:Endopeptidase S2P n=1 Tax=Aegilops tauschii subsp. strangulata TaxID=200361 RepID=A0A453F5A6_AEGTS